MMSSKDTLKQGLRMALGTFVGWAVVLPFLGLFRFKFGLMAGALSALLLILVHYLVALRAPGDGRKSGT